jgi:hypothetical protein
MDRITVLAIIGLALLIPGELYFIWHDQIPVHDYLIGISTGALLGMLANRRPKINK